MRAWPIFIIVFILSFFLCPVDATQGAGGFRTSFRDILGPRSPNSFSLYTIQQVVDNYLIHLTVGHRVRYIGVGDFTASEMKGFEAERAYQFHKDVVFSKIARLEHGMDALDDEGNLLAYVYVRPWPNEQNELFVNAEMIRMGHARFIPDKVNSLYNDYFARLEEEAILNRRGIWATHSSDW